ncbi:MAG: RnfABCDGE type electron transport complex subunit D [Spirochaetales bacterium]|nr:MAG: RnfABCDGE type electron transport complex subunit D [Spirochaetales bacterium]
MSENATMEKQRLMMTSPQLHHQDSTAKIMWAVSICLLPASAWGVYVFGIRALVVLIVSIAAAVAGELAAARIFKKITVQDGSAFLTGLLVGLNMPAGVPLFIPIIASLFAILVVKWSFGGLGANWMNPALAGRVFVFFSWTGGMTTWQLPRALNPSLDAVTGPTPLGFLKTGMMDYTGGASGPMDFLNQSGYARSAMDTAWTGWLNEHIFTGAGKPVPGGYLDLFFGNIPGSIGEISTFLLLLGAVYLFIKKIITWQVPVTYIVSFGVLSWIFGGLKFGGGFFSGDIIFNLFSGGLMLGALYMATDMVTSPLTGKGQIIFGIGAGFFTFLIRFYGSFPEGVSLAIILMNIFVPLINRFTGPDRFGIARKAVPS